MSRVGRVDVESGLVRIGRVMRHREAEGWAKGDDGQGNVID
jgi:hypothetical protein